MCDVPSSAHKASSNLTVCHYWMRSCENRRLISWLLFTIVKIIKKNSTHKAHYAKYELMMHR